LFGNKNKDFSQNYYFIIRENKEKGYAGYFEEFFLISLLRNL